MNTVNDLDNCCNIVIVLTSYYLTIDKTFIKFRLLTDSVVLLSLMFVLTLIFLFLGTEIYPLRSKNYDEYSPFFGKLSKEKRKREGMVILGDGKAQRVKRRR